MLEQLSGQTPVFSKGKFFFSFLFFFFHFFGGWGVGGSVYRCLVDGGKCEKVEGRF